jgi:uncharacterized protein YbaR (Trm112 family)
MFIFETIDCPSCSGKIAVVVENNVITSHGICPGCDKTFSAERLQFTNDVKAMEDQFMAELSDIDVCDYCGRWYTYNDQDEGIYACPGCVATHEVLVLVDEELHDFYKKLIEKGVDV